MKPGVILALLASTYLALGCSSNGPGHGQPPKQIAEQQTAVEPVAPQVAPPKTRGCAKTDEESIDELIYELEKLDRDGASRKQLDAFVAKHHCLVKAKIHPYGSMLMRALEFEREELAFALLDAGSKVPDHAIGLAARGGLNRFIERLLERGASPNAGDSWGYTPLHSAAKYGKTETIELLLKRGAKPTVSSTNDGFTALHVAVMERKVESAKLLIAAEADLEARDHDGRTPLHWGPFAYRPMAKHMYAKLGEPHDTIFVDPGEAVLIDILLDAGAEIDARDDGGDTPLHEATNIGSFRGVEKLLQRGANPESKNKKGQTPMFHVERRGDDEIRQLFEKAR